MNVRRYVSTDMRQGIRQIREDLGPDAVILSTRQVDDGVEISVALDYDNESTDKVVATSSSRPQPQRPSYQEIANSVDATIDPDVEERRRALLSLCEDSDLFAGDEVDDPVGSLAPQGLSSLYHEVRSLRSMLERQFSDMTWSDLARNNAHQAKIFQALLDLGITRELAAKVSRAVSDEVDPRKQWGRALAVLAHQIPIAEHDVLSQGGRIALVGPTGVGKTTTVAKLAARFALRHGADQVAMITTDVYRVGAHDQLGAFAQIMGVPVRVARDADELHQAIEDYADRRLVLIDTAGTSQRDTRFIEQIRLLEAGCRDVKLMLVASATAQTQVIDEAIKQFQEAPIAATIITKLDEAGSLGGILSILCEYQLPVAYLSNGQRVPEDLSSARAHSLVTRAVSLAHRSASESSSMSSTLRKHVNAHG